MTDTRELCTFVSDTLTLGIDMRQVREVVCHQSVTPVPLAPRAVAGLINLRGQIITAYDLRKRFGQAERVVGSSPAHLLVQTATGRVSLLVDTLGEVMPVGSATRIALPEPLPTTLRDLILGIYQRPDDLGSASKPPEPTASGERGSVRATTPQPDAARAEARPPVPKQCLVLELDLEKTLNLSVLNPRPPLTPRTS